MKSFAGIVLAGGKSSRMGTDKAFIALHDRYFYQIASENIKPFCKEIIISINKSQATTYLFEYPVIVDAFEDQGPLSGLVMAFNANPVSYIVIGVDMVKVEHQHIQTLVDNHNIITGCSVYFNNKSGYFEPMLSIWEPDRLKELTKYYDEGGRSFQNFLKSISVNTISCDDCSFLFNANTPDSLLEL